LDPHGRAGTPTVHALSFAVDWATHGLRLSDEQAQEASQLRPTVGAASGRVGLKLVRIGGPLWSPAVACLAWTSQSPRQGFPPTGGHKGPIPTQLLSRPYA